MTMLVLLAMLAMTGCKKSFTITVQSNNEAWGTVTGGGIYAKGETITISAIPAPGYYFISWNDGDNTNPRQVVVNGNATYIATFSDTPGGGGTEGALEVSGSINANTTWPDRGVAVDYIIDGHFYVEGNALLTIEPGVTIMFTGVDGAIFVEENAGLRMVGTAEKPIILTGPTNNPNKGAWNTVYVQSNRADNQFEYVKFINGGSNEADVVYVGGKISMKHCTIDGALGNGICVSGSLSAFENNTIKNVDKFPVWLNDHNMVNSLGSGNNYTNNGKNMICLSAYYLDNTNNVPVTFSKQGIPYYVSQGIHLDESEDKMLVNAGAEFVFAYEAGLRISEVSLLQVNGTSNDPVIFRGEQNESGYWSGIEIYSSRTTEGGNKLINCQIKNAGQHDGAALLTQEETTLSINNVSISGSNGYGMIVTIPVDWDTEQYDFSNYHVSATALTFNSCAQGNIYETNKDQVYNGIPGAKRKK
ncbi:MAG: hypothetical protein J5741_01275 [Bacteroidales bacterium]|nr:hypothetical protein [Bacteroidales bacterium]